MTGSHLVCKLYWKYLIKTLLLHLFPPFVDEKIWTLRQMKACSKCVSGKSECFNFRMDAETKLVLMCVYAQHEHDIKHNIWHDVSGQGTRTWNTWTVSCNLFLIPHFTGMRLDWLHLLVKFCPPKIACARLGMCLLQE